MSNRLFIDVIDVTDRGTGITTPAIHAYDEYGSVFLEFESEGELYERYPSKESVLNGILTHYEFRDIDLDDDFCRVVSTIFINGYDADDMQEYVFDFEEKIFKGPS